MNKIMRMRGDDFMHDDTKSLSLSLHRAMHLKGKQTVPDSIDLDNFPH